MMINQLFMNSLMTSALAETVSQETDAAATSLSSSISSIVLIVIMVVVFYFLLIRPQRKKDKAVKEMLNALKVGDRICTIGGIYGTITRIKDDVLTVEVGDAKTPMVFARWAVKNIDTSSATNDSETLA